MRRLLKFLMAVTMFVTLIIAGSWLALDRLIKSPEKLEISQSDTLPSKKTQLFYKTIGSKRIRSKGTSTKKQLAGDLGARYTVEILVTTNKDRAETAVSALQQRGFDAFYSAFNQRGRVFYKVRTGVFKSKTAATSYLKKVANKQYRGLKVRKL